MDIGTPTQAIAFCLLLHSNIGAEDALQFLADWNVGDLSDWPEYQEFLEKEAA